MDNVKLQEIIKSRGKWLINRNEGSRADLRGADLRGADLPNKIIQVGPIGSRKSYTIYNIDNDIAQCGCWNNYKGGSLEEFIKRIDEVYKLDTQYGKEYRAAIEYFNLMRTINGVNHETN